MHSLGGGENNNNRLNFNFHTHTRANEHGANKQPFRPTFRKWHICANLQTAIFGNALLSFATYQNRSIRYAGYAWTYATNRGPLVEFSTLKRGNCLSVGAKREKSRCPKASRIFHIRKADTSMLEFRSFRFYLRDQQPQNFPRFPPPRTQFVAGNQFPTVWQTTMMMMTTMFCGKPHTVAGPLQSGLRLWVLCTAATTASEAKCNGIAVYNVSKGRNCWMLVCSNVNMSCKFWTIVKSRSNGGAAVWGLGFPGSCAILG